jgi:hypothetical protein
MREKSQPTIQAFFQKKSPIKQTVAVIDLEEEIIDVDEEYDTIQREKKRQRTSNDHLKTFAIADLLRVVISKLQSGGFLSGDLCHGASKYMGVCMLVSCL